MFKRDNLVIIVNRATTSLNEWVFEDKLKKKNESRDK